MNDKISKMFFIIADISGYTEFMLNNTKSLRHSQIIITSLINSIIEEISIPLKISKLEGDAVFIYSLDYNDETVIHIKNKLFKFYDNFRHQLSHLERNNICDCNACTNLNKLKIKFLVHFGEALLYKIGDFNELSGKDVILIHRLLKNQIKSSEYILLTETAHSLLNISQVDFIKYIEKYEHFEPVNIYVHDFHIDPVNKIKEKPASLFSKSINTIIFMAKEILFFFVRKKIYKFLNYSEKTIKPEYKEKS